MLLSSNIEELGLILFLCSNRLIIKTTAKYVSKVEKLFYVIPVLELTIWFVWNPSWMKRQKENGVVHIVKMKVINLNRTYNF